MSLPEFELVRPKILEEALRFLADHGRDTMVMAGGTDAIPNLRMRLFSPRYVLDIKGVGELSGITSSVSNGLRIGALTTITGIAETRAIRAAYPVLSEAASAIASPLLRNMGTIGGNLCLETRCRWYNQSFFWRDACGFCLKKDGSICHVAPGGQRCWAVWSGDTAPALLTLDAEAEIASVRGRRRVRLNEFYKNDGMDRIRLERDELLTAIFLPARMAGYRGCYKKFRVRNSIDYPLVGVAAVMKTDRSGTCQDARLALGAVNPAPLLVPDVASLLAGKRISRELLEEAARMAASRGKPLTTSASTPEYRREILRVFTRRALEAVWRDGARA